MGRPGASERQGSGGPLARIYAYKALDDLMPIYPLYAVMFVDHGVTPSGLAVLLAVWSAVALALEIPSGLLADHASRRRLLVFGQLLRAAGYACWLLVPTFWGFMAGFVLWGVKSALQSGTFEALVYDELDRLGRADAYAKVIGRARAVSILAVLVAMLAAAPLQSLGGYTLLTTLSIGAGLAAAALAAMLPQAPMRRSTGERAIFGHLRAGLHEAFSTPSIRLPMTVLAAVLILGGSLDEFWGVYGQAAGLERQVIPILYAATYAASAVAAALAHRLAGLRPIWHHLLIAACGLTLVAAAAMMNLPGMLLLALFTAGMKLVEINYESKMQQSIPTERRATVSSIAGFLWGAGSIGVYLVFGEIAEIWGYPAAFAAFGAAAIAAGAAFASSRASRRLRS